jgi:hypothetical protein
MPYKRPLAKMLKSLPNPPLSKGREPNFSCFPPKFGGTEGGEFLNESKRSKDFSPL